MGLFSSIRAAQRMRDRSGYGDFTPRVAKNPYEKIIDGKKEAYPNTWRYFTNRLSKGILDISADYQKGKVKLTPDQLTILHDLCSKYWVSDRKKLVVPGEKNMKFVNKLQELVPDLDLFKMLYGRRGSWSSEIATVELKSPVNGSKWLRGHFIEKYQVPILLLYKRPEKSKEKAKLIEPNNEQANGKLQKVLIKPTVVQQEDKKWLYGSSYWAWLPAIEDDKVFYELTAQGSKRHSVYDFWKLKRENKLQ